ncbi:hypothetical protein [Phenylobacterium sp.]|jgi:hypothetical protein|uniref:hypothetical protein n=1 Tax=Phenylobacterium sp. TaxID=1871053 RepID=UPI002E301084|nr:hypothetical protein [Phenylobacterium sp.]HEX4709943.1 hypothetical protein [Phenylobacterium sp.]
MVTREQRIYEEAAALWREVFDEPPPARASGSAMLDIITRRLGEIAYERLRSPHLRPSTIVGPGQPKAQDQGLY